jgi:uncharacterized protein (TIGR00375 family)
MQVIADLHTHSRFARACSAQITIGTMASTAKSKGIGLLSTGDILHPEWLKEVKRDLEDGGNGLSYPRNGDRSVAFVLGVEVCTISQHKGAAKKVHHCILLPRIESAEALADALKRYGNMQSDGRPILMMSSAELVEKLFSVEQNAFVFPAHAWTPYYGVLGSISGFNSIKDAYEDQEQRVHALETGLSSSPDMNWRVSALDRYALVSGSDMHSLGNMGREACVFEMPAPSYNDMIKAIQDKDAGRFKRTVEFYPEEGKYHYDGHRECSFSVNPASGITRCGVCGKPLVIGVLHRVNDLADRPVGFVPKNSIPFISSVPLSEVLAYVLRKTKYSVAVGEMYNKLVEAFGTEMNVLTEASAESIREVANEDVAQAIENVRSGRIRMEPGYAGVYGKLDLLSRNRSTRGTISTRQRSLFDSDYRSDK